jgi:hypothetical protein
LKRLVLLAAIATVVMLTFASTALAEAKQYAQYDQYVAKKGAADLVVLPDTGGPSLVVLPLGALLLGCGILVAKRATS